MLERFQNQTSLFSLMQFSDYFQYTRLREDRKHINMDWIEQAFYYPMKTQIQKDGRTKHWAYISEVDKYLRIIVLEDNLTIHNAFFDRSFKP